MMPKGVVHIEKIPLNKNGKIDRKILNNIKIKENTFNQYEAPINEVEKKICNIFEDVLKIEKTLEKKIPHHRWGKTHHQLVLFGRYHCKAMKPDCAKCKISDICKYKNRNR